ncbi:ATP-binding protein [Halorubrum sp. SD626R]|uniref:ATP-binding protein n=1 Tax=Halorubrum sp. SD626R TaxID=1419722 RepID=UPI0018EE99B8|nr:ATP-binding protein [Halorubrum sp. SD626R]
MHLLIAAISGWGKGYLTQSLCERNLPRYDSVVIMDYSDEYRGLVEAGLADWWIGGPVERNWSASDWGTFLDENPRVVIARHDTLSASGWQDLAASVAEHIRGREGSVLFVVDEAHFVIPQGSGFPTVLKELATTGRGEQVSYVVISQRLSEVEKTVTTQMQSRLLGGFDGDDIGRVSDVIDGYPARLHNPQADLSPGSVPDDLLPSDRDRPTSVQRHTNDQNQTIGSEWIFSDSAGNRSRKDTRGIELAAPHYSPEGADLEIP